MHKLHDSDVQSLPYSEKEKSIHLTLIFQAVLGFICVAELPVAPVTGVAGTYTACFQLTSTSSVSERLSVPLLSRESDM